MTDWTGRPWQRPHGCWRLFCAFYAAELGIVLPTYDDQAPDDDGPALAALIIHELDAWREIAPGNERYGDGVLIRIAGAPSHIGVVLGNGRMLHVLMDGHDSCIESYRTPKWRQRIEGFYRHKALA